MKKKDRASIQKFNISDVVIYAVLGAFALVTLYLFIYTLAGSLNDAQDLAYGPIWLFPRKLTFASYIVTLEDTRLYRAFLNTFAAMAVCVVIGLLFTSCVAYAMSRKRLKGRKFFWSVNLITMFISGGMIPYYMVIMFVGLYNNYLVYIIPCIYSVFDMIVLANFFKSIDESLYESAVMDGANEFRIWLSIYIPVSKPALATIGLWIIVARWNSFMPTMLYTDKRESIWLMQYYLMRLIRDGDTPMKGDYYRLVNATTLSFAAIVVSSIPILCVYPFMNRFFSKGIMLGSLKG